ncbi:MAG: GNAT family N-acetyltransferase [Betaproteobacteria bacterium]|nr:GNAT family N-acetyltransferase [Betaproteobacteria bacterium]
MLKNPLRWENVDARSLAQRSDLRASWDQLNGTRGALPFLDSEAMVCALQILGDGSERLLLARCDGALQAMFLLIPQGAFKWSSFQPSQMPLGAWVARPELALTDLARSLLRGPLGLCLVLSITQVDPCIASRAGDAPDRRHSDYVDTGWIDINGSFDLYWASRGKNLRQNMRKQRAKLLAEGVGLRLQVLREHAQMAPAIIHPDNQQGRYYRALLEKASLRGEALVTQYLFDDRVVAMNLCLEREGTLIVLKTTYDESIKTCSPAFLLRESELQQIHAEGRIKRVEYFGRVMDWHTKLTDRKRGLYHLSQYRWPVLRRVAEWRQPKLPLEDA